MAGRNVTLQMLIQDKIQDLYLKSSASNIVIDSTTGETLSQRLESINTALDTILTESEAQALIKTAIDEVVGGAPETYDTLKEIADYIASHQDTVDLLNNAIGNKVDKVEGKGLSTNDFTDELKTKLESMSASGTQVEASEVNGSIKIDGVETVVYTHPTGEGYEHIPAGGAEGQVLMKSTTGVTWEDLSSGIRYGETTPDDLADGELFIKLEPETETPAPEPNAGV